MKRRNSHNLCQNSTQNQIQIQNQSQSQPQPIITIIIIFGIQSFLIIRKTLIELPN